MRCMSKEARIYVAGHTGLLGSAVVRHLKACGYSDLLIRSSRTLDLRCQQAVSELFLAERPEFVILAAARVGGIVANDSRPADFILDNLLIQTNVIRAAWQADVKRLIFIGSTCIYPRDAPQPLREAYLLTGPLEKTNEWYAVAKIAGVKLCQALRKQYGCDFLSVMSTNLYGPVDNFDLETSHVLPALLRKFHEAKTAGNRPVTLWGTGTPRREFLYVDDLADACRFVLEKPEDRLLLAAPDCLLNVGAGADITIRELAEIIQRVVESDCPVLYDRSKPDGTPRKLVDVTRLSSLGWKASTSLVDGITKTYDWYVRESQ